MSLGHVLVVGGSHGIGLSVVEQLLEKRYEVTVASRTNTAISHLPLSYIEMDVLKEVDSIKDLGPLRALVYCPGSINLKPFTSLSTSDFNSDFEINVLGAIKCIQATLPALKVGNGSIVLFSSVAASQGMAYHASVAASKGAIEALCRSLAAEFAPSVRVNAIAPSLTDTPLAAHLLNHEKKRELNEQRHPLKRIGRAEDIASMALHLISDHGSWITGQVFAIDGGLSNVR
jgi:3-oxoacyl-[acyl-carrier protein] reductase